jgi:hypothetical protein
MMMLEGKQSVSCGLDHSVADPRYWFVHVLVQLIVGLLPSPVALCVVYYHSCTHCYHSIWCNEVHDELQHDFIEEW